MTRLGAGRQLALTLLWASSALFSACSLLGCSLLNAPDDIVLGTGANGVGGTGEGGTGATPATGGGGMGGGGCVDDRGCTALDSGCVTGHCNALHECEPMPAVAGTPCGAAPTDDCDAPDQCDGAGQCQALLEPDGTYCGDCPAGEGSCDHCIAGACGDCATRATLKTFGTPFAVSGWTLGGSWGVFKEAPATSNTQDFTLLGSPALPFSNPVFGTDGNRERPYPGAEVETSQADTPPFVLPASLNFYSWNVDEGFQFDSKSISISTDGGQTFDIVAICPEQGGGPIPFAFCNSVTFDRPIDSWDYIQVPVPAVMQGQVGIVRFKYFSQDYLTGLERGWFIDRLEFATECACSAPEDCGYLDGTCATGACDAATSECKLTPQALGDACTADGENECSGPDTCDAFGLCDKGAASFESVACTGCTEPGACAGCSQGDCIDCKALQSFQHLQGAWTQPQLEAKGWTFGQDWTIRDHIPPNTTDASAPEFPDFSIYVLEHVLGTDGSRNEAAPPGNDISNGAVTTSPTLIPATLELRSWHQDRGGQLGRDNKRIRVSVDGGASWTVISDCSNTALTPIPEFCTDWTPMSATNRAIDDWDDVSIDVPAALVGQTGIFEFAYNTVDGGLGWERGWYLDDLNINRCD